MKKIAFILPILTMLVAPSFAFASDNCGNQCGRDNYYGGLFDAPLSGQTPYVASGKPAPKNLAATKEVQRRIAHYYSTGGQGVAGTSGNFSTFGGGGCNSRGC